MDAEPNVVEAIEEFEPLRPTELRLRVGEKFIVVQNLSDGWLYGQDTHGNEGTFPSTHVKGIEPPAVEDTVHYYSTSTHSEENNGNELKHSLPLDRNSYALVLYDFLGSDYKSPHEAAQQYLGVCEGDTVVILNFYNSEWLWARKENGREGFVPASYVSAIEEEPTDELYSGSFEDLTGLNDAEREPVACFAGECASAVVGRSRHDNQLAPDVHTDCKLSYVLREIYETEYCFVKDMTLLKEVLEATAADSVLNTALITAYLCPVISVATTLLDSLPNVDCINSCGSSLDVVVKSVACAFLDNSVPLEQAYASYSQNFHEIINACASSISESSPNGIVRQLRQRGIMCFNLETTLLKPVQRVLKYPLLLSQLKSALYASPKNANIDLLCSSLTLKSVGEAVDAVQRIAEAVNESKRKQELLDKYRRRLSKSGELRSLPRKLADSVSLEVVARKSSRLMFEVRTGLGLAEIPPDPVLDTHICRFNAVHQCIKRALRDFTNIQVNVSQRLPHGLLLMSDLDEVRKLLSQEGIAENAAESTPNEQKRAIDEFVDAIGKRILNPLNSLNVIMMDEKAGPRAFIEKCHNKRLDYARILSDQNNADTDKQLLTRNVYTALREQLTSDLSQFNLHVQGVLSCTMQIHAYSKRILLFRMLRVVEQQANNVSRAAVMQSMILTAQRRSELMQQISALEYLDVLPIATSMPQHAKNAPVDDTAIVNTVTVHRSEALQQPSVRRKRAPPRPPPVFIGRDKQQPATEPRTEMSLPSKSGNENHSDRPKNKKEPQKSGLFRRVFTTSKLPQKPIDTVSQARLQAKQVVLPSYVTGQMKRTALCVVCFDFVAEHDVELSCEAGDVVVVLNRQDLSGNSEWFYVEKCVERTKVAELLNSCKESTESNVSGAGCGYVPASYLQLLPEG